MYDNLVFVQNCNIFKKVLILLLILPIISHLFKITTAFTPTDSSYAFKKCQNESNVNDSKLISKWNIWNFPNNKNTHCYIKCILFKLGLINLKNRGLNSDKIENQFKQHDLNLTDNILKWIGTPLDNTCKSYYQKWIALNSVYNNTVQLIFYGNEEGIDAFYQIYPNGSKLPGQTASDYCNGEFGGYPPRNTSESECYLQCVYKNFHYLDAYGRVDPKEIISSVNDVKQKSELLENVLENRTEISYDSIVKRCAHQANQFYPYGQCKVALTLHLCLKQEIHNYKRIYKHRDKITSYY